MFWSLPLTCKQSHVISVCVCLVGVQLFLNRLHFSYTAQVQMAGGSCNFVALQLDTSSKKWELDLNAFEAAITPKTKIILLNNPHNPTGKVFSMEEMQAMADIVRRNPHVTVV